MSARTSRRGFLMRGAGVAAAMTLPLLDPGAGVGPRSALAATDNAARAADTYNAMQRYFAVAGTALFRETYPMASGDTPYSYLWAFEEATRATLAMGALPGGASAYGGAIQNRLSGREAYWDGRASPRAYRAYPATGDRYYDDNSWAGGNLLLHQAVATDGSAATALARARGVFEFVAGGWDTGLPKAGGVFWVKTSWNMDRGTGPTGGGATLAARLFDVTGRTDLGYLGWARRMYDWARQYLLAPNGLYWDNVRPDGSIVTDQWIYNQGVMIGAGVALALASDDAMVARAYLDEATRLADRALAFYATDDYYSGGRGSYSGQGIFNAIFFRNLLLLRGLTGNATYLTKVQGYADRAWDDTRVRNSSTGLFKVDRTSATYSLLDQAAMVQVYAGLPPVRSSGGPRPAVRVAAAPGRDERGAFLDVTVTGGAPPLSGLRFGLTRPVVNGRVELGGRSFGAGDVLLAPGAALARFAVRRVTDGRAMTVPFSVIDAYGPWETFVGAGPNAL